MKKASYTNRYNDVFTFSLDEDKNIIWAGDFEYCRNGFPNNYDAAYKKYYDVEGNPPHDHTLSLKEFKEEVHRQLYDDKGVWSKPCKIAATYQSLVTSDMHIIDMVDPSGGPYISSGTNMGHYGDEFKGLKVKSFEAHKKGYKIITEKT